MNLQVSTKITKSDKYVTGLRLGNQFIKGNSEVLIKAVQQSLEERNQKDYIVLKSMLTKAINALNNKSGKAAYDTYMVFEKHLLKLFEIEQIPISIIAITTSNDGSKQFNYSANIKDSLGVRSKNIYSTNSKRIHRNYALLTASELLSEHLIKFIKIMEPQYKKYNYRQEQIEGFIADAYMQHVAVAHIDLLSGQIPKNIKTLPSDFKGVTVKLAKDSRNTTRWYSSGDVVIINKAGQVILNTQIKHSIKKSGVVGHIATKELLDSLNQLREALEINDYKSMAEQIYKMYSTSAIVNQIDESLDEMGNRLNISTI